MDNMRKHMEAAKREIVSVKADLANGVYPTRFGHACGNVDRFHRCFYGRRNIMYQECTDAALRDALYNCRFEPHWPDVAEYKKELDTMEAQITEITATLDACNWFRS
jgi:hypothetical protein